jgi:hypothetical protein
VDEGGPHLRPFLASDYPIPRMNSIAGLSFIASATREMIDRYVSLWGGRQGRPELAGIKMAVGCGRGSASDDSCYQGRKLTNRPVP